MLKEAIEKIEEMAKPQIVEVNGVTYAVEKSGVAFEIRQVLDRPDEKALSSLDALIQIVKTEALRLYTPPIYIEAEGYSEVSCFLRTDPEQRYNRDYLYSVEATDVPGWADKTELPFEEALIAIRTRFQPSPDADYLLRLLSEITSGAKVTYADNGIATTVVSQKGISLQSSEAIRPIITLRPYRTFQEIDQPVSEFHIRIGERSIRFIEADGGMWKLHARRTIVEYLNDHLVEEREDGRVVIML